MWARPAAQTVRNVRPPSSVTRVLCLTQLPQGLRRYATEPHQSFPKGPLYAVGAAGIGAGAVWYWNRNSKPARQATSAVKSLVPSGNKAFKGGEQSFVDLKLEAVEEVSPNTKRFRFALPEADDVSGLETACAYSRPTRAARTRWRRAD